jgi:membrane fusion protein (multidrug efflux system)
MPNDRFTHVPDYEVEQLRDEIRRLREEQERQKQRLSEVDLKTEKPQDGQDRKPADEKAGAPENEQQQTPESPQKRRLKKVIALVVILVVAALGLLWWLHARQFEQTDDAQVDGHLSGLAARVASTVSAVYVEENQFVEAGQLIATLDSQDQKVAVQLAQSQLAQAQAQTQAEQPNVPVTETSTRTNIAISGEDVNGAAASVAAANQNYEAALARVRDAEANNAKAQADVERYRPLAEKDEVPREQFDQVIARAKATVAANQASALAALRQADQSRAQELEAQERAAQARTNAPHEIDIRRANVAARQAAVRTARSQVDQAQLNLGYTQIFAPVKGIVAKRSAEVGQHVTPGQQLSSSRRPTICG